MVLKVAVVEDKRDDQEALVRILRKWEEKADRACRVMIEVYTTGEAFLKQPGWYHIVFIDIGLDGELNGIQAAKRLRSQGSKVQVVFLSGSDVYAKDGYGVNAMDYLCKPAAELEVFRCMERIFQRFSDAGYMIENRNRVQEIPYENIMYFFQDQHYINVVTSRGTFKHRASIKDLENRLPVQFVRCNRGIIINIMQVDYIEKNYAIVGQKIRIPISEPYLSSVREGYKERYLYR